MWQPLPKSAVSTTDTNAGRPENQQGYVRAFGGCNAARFLSREQLALDRGPRLRIRALPVWRSVILKLSRTAPSKNLADFSAGWIFR